MPVVVMEMMYIIRMSNGAKWQLPGNSSKPYVPIVQMGLCCVSHKTHKIKVTSADIVVSRAEPLGGLHYN